MSIWGTHFGEGWVDYTEMYNLLFAVVVTFRTFPKYLLLTLKRGNEQSTYTNILKTSCISLQSSYTLSSSYTHKNAFPAESGVVYKLLLLDFTGDCFYVALTVVSYFLEIPQQGLAPSLSTHHVYNSLCD